MSDASLLIAETNWLPVIRPYLQKLFDGHWLPSHDLSHHTRVWKNACLLVKDMKNADKFFFEKLLIACFFHDVGLLKDSSSRHGIESRRMCEEFLAKYPDKVLFGCESLLDAIENHDDKNYQSESTFNVNTIYKLLAMADDIDAFGALGAYRYIEIYLLRKIDPGLIPGKVLTNADNRYANLINTAEIADNMLMAEITKKYELLRQIFMPETFAEPVSSLVHWLNLTIVIPRHDPRVFLKEESETASGNSRIDFFIKCCAGEFLE
jgi:hypothetical protein